MLYTYIRDIPVRKVTEQDFLLYRHPGCYHHHARDAEKGWIHYRHCFHYGNVMSGNRFQTHDDDEGKHHLPASECRQRQQ